MKSELRRALLLGRRRPRLIGAGSPTAIRGDGYEFAQLREYVAGDDPRRIDWAATARAGALQTRVVLEDVALTLAAIVDRSNSMQLGRSRPLDVAAQEALTTWYEAAETDDRCVRITSSGVHAPPALRGRRSALVCSNVGDNQPFVLQRALDMARCALGAGAALLVVSDFYDLKENDVPLLRRLSRRLDCTALVARDPWFDHLPLRGFVTICDAESAAQRRLFIGEPERRRYRCAVMKREHELRKLFHTAGWRTGALQERDGRGSLYNAFGIPSAVA
ncbi:MAG: DUF58 domain-containing protein [Candidatus Eremiobacteraeota bacterium]|nr:DUF58 domain-containing protein [Candidatus Eremiobacteraeota bacterium]